MNSAASAAGTSTRRGPESAVDATASPAQAIQAAGKNASPAPVGLVDEPRSVAHRTPAPVTAASHPHNRGAERAATSAGCSAARRRAPETTYRNGSPPVSEVGLDSEALVTGRATAPSQLASDRAR